MTLSSSAMIHSNTGCLFNPPFLSRCLFYRLYDIQCSLLVHHEPNVFSSGQPHISDDLFGRTTMNDGCIVISPKLLKIHFLPSIEKDWKELSKTEARTLELSEGADLHQLYEEVELKVEWLHVPVRECFFVFEPTGPGVEHRISRIRNTTYAVRSWNTITNIGAELDSAELAGLTCRCWKVSVVSRDNNAEYGLNSARDWSLTVVDEDKQEATMEMFLASGSERES